jgi:hypothetical protein
LRIPGAAVTSIGPDAARGLTSVSPVPGDAATRACAYDRAVIGHALLRASGPAALAGLDRPIAAGFAVGSACFLIGPFPGVVQLVGVGADAVIFFAGSLFFTFAAGLELRQATLRRGARFGADAAWWSAAIQFAGTLLFNLDTYDAMQTGLSSHQEDRLVWTPDLIGSACFLAAGVLAYAVVRHEDHRGRTWRMATVNLAGCVLFGVSAIASYVVPATGSIVDLAAANWGTALGAACFLAGALLLWPSPDPAPPEEVRP